MAQFKKNGKEIMELFKKMTKDGMNPEDSMLYLLAYMEKHKASKIGMDITAENGHSFCLTIEIKDGTIDSQEEILPPVKKGITPGVI